MTTPHVWTTDEIRAHVPRFGDLGGSWFYGLVPTVNADDQPTVTIAEIYPGEGWVSIELGDIADAWPTIVADLQTHRPHARAGGYLA